LEKLEIYVDSVNMNRMYLAINVVYSGVKVNFTIEQATKTQRGSRGIALLYL